MEDLTNTTSTKEWVSVTKGMRISAYIGSPLVTTGTEDHPFTLKGFEQVLKRVSRPTRAPAPGKER